MKRASRIVVKIILLPFIAVWFVFLLTFALVLGFCEWAYEIPGENILSQLKRDTLKFCRNFFR